MSALCPLTDATRRYIERLLRNDPVARQHGGRPYRPVLRFAAPLLRPIVLGDVVKGYESILDVEGLPEEIRKALLTFGVDRRAVQKLVLRGASMEINPGEIAGISEPDSGEVRIPGDARISVLIPGKRSPSSGTKHS